MQPLMRASLTAPDEGLLGRGAKKKTAMCRMSHKCGVASYYINLLVRITQSTRPALILSKDSAPKDLPTSHLTHLLKFLPVLNIGTLGIKPLAHDPRGTNHIQSIVGTIFIPTKDPSGLFPGLCSQVSALCAGLCTGSSSLAESLEPSHVFPVAPCTQHKVGRIADIRTSSATV